MNENSSKPDPAQPERREWDKPELEVVPMREALASTPGTNIVGFDGAFSYS